MPEVGAGSGYAAAVMGRIAASVHTVERHAALAAQARGRFDQLGYDNIELRVGDGSRGRPEAAPFDAILVAAGAPDTPPALRGQLAIGGRLVVPVGDDEHVLPRQFDAWAWFDRTVAVTPLGSGHPGPGMPDTWPTGL